MKGFPVVPKESSGFSSPAFYVLLVMWWRRRWVHLSLHTYLIIVVSPSSLAANMDTESFLDGVQHCQILYKQP